VLKFAITPGYDRRLIEPSRLPSLRIPYANQRQHPAHGGRVVYYLERGDGMIKIGTTANFSQRRSSLRREHGPLTLLAWEHGSYELEKGRHALFEYERPEKSEWFEPSWFLINHIMGLRAAMA
jgi:hypothetical protein